MATSILKGMEIKKKPFSGTTGQYGELNDIVSGNESIIAINCTNTNVIAIPFNGLGNKPIQRAKFMSLVAFTAIANTSVSGTVFYIET